MEQLRQEALSELRTVRTTEDPYHHRDNDEAERTRFVDDPHPTESSDPQEGHGDHVGSAESSEMEEGEIEEEEIL